MQRRPLIICGVICLALAGVFFGLRAYRTANFYTGNRLRYSEAASRELIDFEYKHYGSFMFYANSRTSVIEQNNWPYDVEAVRFYRDFIARHPNTTSALTAKLQAAFELRSFREARAKGIQMLDKIINDHPDTWQGLLARERKGVILEQEFRDKKSAAQFAVQYFERIVDVMVKLDALAKSDPELRAIYRESPASRSLSDKQGTFAAGVLYRIAEAHATLGNQEKARQVHGRVLRDYPASAMTGQSAFKLCRKLEHERLWRFRESWLRRERGFTMEKYRALPRGNITQLVREMDRAYREKQEMLDEFEIAEELGHYGPGADDTRLRYYRGVYYGLPDSKLAVQAGQRAVAIMARKVDWRNWLNGLALRVEGTPVERVIAWREHWRAKHPANAFFAAGKEKRDVKRLGFARALQAEKDWKTWLNRKESNPAALLPEEIIKMRRLWTSRDP